jgi:hypothetical protein
MTQNFIKIYMGNDLAFVSVDNDIIVGRSHLANRVQLITPVTLGTDDVMQIYFELANGNTTPKRSMVATGSTETVGGDQWNVYRYDIPQSVLSAVTSANAATIKVQFRKATIGQGEGNPVDSGTATAGGNTTLTDSAQTWDTNEYANFVVFIVSGTGAGQKRTIASNTATALTVSTAWTVNPNTTSVYSIRPITTIAQALITSAQVSLALDASIIPNLDDEVIEIDVFDELSGDINNKLNKNFTQLAAKAVPDDTDLLAIDEGNGTNKKVTVATIIAAAVTNVEGLIADVEEVQNFVDQDVSIGSNPAFATPTVDGVTFRDNGNTTTIDYADAIAVGNTAAHIASTANPHSVTATQVGLGNVDNTSDANKPISSATQTALDGKQATLVSGTNIKSINSASILASGNLDLIAASEKGQAGGVATLDAITGKVPASQLPAFVDDLEEYANLAAFPVTGESDKIYVALDTGKIYRWSGSQYVEIAANEVNSVNGATGVVVLTATNIGASGFDGRLTGLTTTQAALDYVDDADATDTPTVTGSFNKLLSAADDTVQKALDTLDDHTHTEADITDLDKYTQTEVDGFLADKVDVTSLSSTIILYPTTAASDISGYSRLVDSIDDADYDEPAVDVPTGVISGQDVAIASLVADAGLFIGNPGIINISVLGKIRKTAGGAGQGAAFYYEVYLRNAGGTETLLSTSDTTRTVTEGTYQEFFASALLNNGNFTATDRIVYKFYGNNVGGGNPEFDFEFGGSSPVRALLPLPVNVTLQADKVFYDNTGQNLVATNVQAAINEIDDLVEEGLTVIQVVTYVVTDADDGSGGFTYTVNGGSPVTGGTITSGVYEFPLPEGIEYATGSNRLSIKIDGSDGALKRFYFGADTELSEPDSENFGIDFAFADNDVLYAKIYQSLATVSLDIADGAITEGKIANGAVTTNKLANNTVDFTKVQQIATNTILGNDTGGTANVKALTASEAKVLLALNNVDNTTDLNKPISTNTQTALDLKADKASSAALTANRAIATDGTGKLVVSAVTNTELGHLSGVTSAIQTQLGSKLTSADGDTLTASRVVVTESAGRAAASSITTTELETLSGVTSAIQTQLNAKGTGDADVFFFTTTIAAVRLDRQ